MSDERANEQESLNTSPPFQLVYGINDEEESVGSPEEDLLPVNHELDRGGVTCLLDSADEETAEVSDNEQQPLTNSTPPVDPSDTPPVGPSDTPPVGPSDTPPVDPSDTPPVDPSDTPPVDPSDTPPVDPSETPPVGPSNTPPVDPSDTPPVDPSDTPPVDPSDTPPVDPSDTPPVGPSDTLPVDPSDTPPVDPSDTPPVDPSDTPPVGPSDTPPVSPTVSLSPNVSKGQSHEGIFFSGIRYLGSSTVDAPVSETEANRKMGVLKSQTGQPMPIILQIPPNNDGNIMLKDPSTDQILTAFSIKHVLFCARGDINSNLNDCLALNVIHKRSGVYHCHVFLCEIPEAVSFNNF